MRIEKAKGVGGAHRGKSRFSDAKGNGSLHPLYGTIFLELVQVYLGKNNQVIFLFSRKTPDGHLHFLKMRRPISEIF